MIDLQPATPEQIAMFKQGAADRYRELQVPPAIAEQLFAAKMAALETEMFGKQAVTNPLGPTKEVTNKAMGISTAAQPVQVPKITAAVSSVAKAKTPDTAKVASMASKVAAALGIQRKAKA